MSAIIAFHIQFKKETFNFNLQPETTIAQVKALLLKSTGIVPEYQKLLFKGILKDDNTIIQCKILNGSKVLLIATPQENVEALHNTEKKVGKRMYLKPLAPKRSTLAQLGKYTFTQLKVLPEFPNQPQALAFLERLKEDPGVCAVMAKYSWQVGSLIELSPAEKTLLGYNRNKGQIIALRLRTNDLEGFIHYPTVKKVLMHELAHMVHSDHDDKFHALNRQLNKEVKELDWTQSNGHRVGPREDVFDPNRVYYSSKLGNEGFKLGGSKVDKAMFNESQEHRRTTIAKALDKRLTKEEEELVQACGSNPTFSSSTK